MSYYEQKISDQIDGGLEAMKQMDIINGNKLIAEFDGKIKDSDSEWWRGFDLIIHKKPSSHESQLEYHSSWDWIMQVVDKIESLRHPRTFTVKIFNNHCRIGDFKPVTHCGSKITAVWLAVIEFINWHNKNKQC